MPKMKYEIVLISCQTFKIFINKSMEIRNPILRYVSKASSEPKPRNEKQKTVISDLRKDGAELKTIIFTGVKI